MALCLVYDAVSLLRHRPFEKVSAHTDFGYEIQKLLPCRFPLHGTKLVANLPITIKYCTDKKLKQMSYSTLHWSHVAYFPLALLLTDITNCSKAFEHLSDINCDNRSTLSRTLFRLHMLKPWYELCRFHYWDFWFMSKFVSMNTPASSCQE